MQNILCKLNCRVKDIDGYRSTKNNGYTYPLLSEFWPNRFIEELRYHAKIKSYLVAVAATGMPCKYKRFVSETRTIVHNQR